MGRDAFSIDFTDPHWVNWLGFGLVSFLVVGFLHQSGHSNSLPRILGCGGLLLSRSRIFVPHQGLDRVSAAGQRFFEEVYF